MGNTYGNRSTVISSQNPNALPNNQMVPILQSILDQQNEFYEQQLSSLRSLQKSINTSLGNLVDLLQSQDTLIQSSDNDLKKSPDTEPEHQPVIIDAAKEYRHKILDLCNTICNQTDFSDAKGVLSYAYKTITRKYGIVWEQEKREYCRQYGKYPKSTLTMISESDDSKYYKGILKSILTDMAWNTKPTTSASAGMSSPIVAAGNESNDSCELHIAVSWDDVPDRIRLLADLCHDKSSHSMRTYAKIYALMDAHNHIDWNNYKLACRQGHKVSDKVRVSKKEIVGCSQELQELFIGELNKQIAEYQEGK